MQIPVLYHKVDKQFMGRGSFFSKKQKWINCLIRAVWEVTEEERYPWHWTPGWQMLLSNKKYCRGQGIKGILCLRYFYWVPFILHIFFLCINYNIYPHLSLFKYWHWFQSSAAWWPMIYPTQTKRVSKWIKAQ